MSWLKLVFQLELLGKSCLSAQNLGFFCPKPFFARKKFAFQHKTIFFLAKPIFLVKIKKRIFLESGRVVSQKMFFWLEKVGFPFQNSFFLAKSLFSIPKPSFSCEKVGFYAKTIFFL